VGRTGTPWVSTTIWLFVRVIGFGMEDGLVGVRRKTIVAWDRAKWLMQDI